MVWSGFFRKREDEIAHVPEGSLLVRRIPWIAVERWLVNESPWTVSELSPHMQV